MSYIVCYMAEYQGSCVTVGVMQHALFIRYDLPVHNLKGKFCPPKRKYHFLFLPKTWLNATFCFLWFTNCVLLFDKNLILGCLWLLVFVLNNILILGIWCSTIPHLPGCFCPWTFFDNIGFNTVLTDPFMSHLATQLGYSAGEFQALQLIVLAAFGVVD